MRTVSALKKVGRNTLKNLDNSAAKIILATEETATSMGTELLFAGVGVLTNLAIDNFVPEGWHAATQVVGSLDYADIVEATDMAADIAIGGAILSAANKFKNSYASLSKMSEVSDEEFEQMINRKQLSKAEEEDVEKELLGLLG